VQKHAHSSKVAGFRLSYTLPTIITMCMFFQKKISFKWLNNLPYLNPRQYVHLSFIPAEEFSSSISWRFLLPSILVSFYSFLIAKWQSRWATQSIFEWSADNPFESIFTRKFSSFTSIS